MTGIVGKPVTKNRWHDLAALSMEKADLLRASGDELHEWIRGDAISIQEAADEIDRLRIVVAAFLGFNHEIR